MGLHIYLRLNHPQPARNPKLWMNWIATEVSHSSTLLLSHLFTWKTVTSVAALYNCVSAGLIFIPADLVERAGY